MAGSKKHMQRSHRSVSSQSGSQFNTFRQHANTKMATKQQKLTLGQLFRRMCPSTRKDV